MYPAAAAVVFALVMRGAQSTLSLVRLPAASLPCWSPDHLGCPHSRSPEPVSQEDAKTPLTDSLWAFQSLSHLPRTMDRLMGMFRLPLAQSAPQHDFLVLWATTSAAAMMRLLVFIACSGLRHH